MIIMLSGHAGCGKDTAFRLIKKNLNGAKRFAFADELKNIAKRLTWDGKKDTAGRRFLQLLGQLARGYNEDVWADMIARRLREYNGIAVITDFRFPNEYDVISKVSTDVVTVRISGRKKDLGDNEKDISEHALDKFPFDYYIENSGTVSEFENKLLGVLDNVHIHYKD